MNSISGLSPVGGANVPTMRHWIAISYGQTGYSQMRGLKPSERISIGRIHKLPSIRRKRASILIRICLQLFFQKMAYRRRIRMGALSSSLNGFHVLMYLPDWAISVQSQKLSPLPPSHVTSESICSKRVLTKFGLQAGSVFAIHKIGLYSLSLYRNLWLYYYRRGIGGGRNCWEYHLRRKHWLCTNWRIIGWQTFVNPLQVVRELD